MNNQAIAKLLKLITAHPQDWGAYQKLAALMVQQQEFHAAEQYYLQAIALCPEQAELHLQLGHLHMRTQQFAAAHASYKQAIALASKQASLYLFDARALNNLGRPAEAILRLRTACKLDPRNLQAINECVDLMCQQQQFSAAMALLQQAVNVHATDASLHYRLGMLCQQQGDRDAALRSLNQAVDIDAEFAEAWHQRALMLQAQGDIAAALDSFNAAIAAQPDAPVPYNNRGVVLCQGGHYAAAIADFKQALQRYPGYAAAQANLGLALYEYGDHTAALPSLEAALQLAPEHARARYVWSMLLLAQGDYSPGWPHYDARLQLLPACVPSSGSGAQRQVADPAKLWTTAGPLIGQTLLLWAEQQLSDTLQFCRYVALVQACKPNQILLAVPDALYHLLHAHWAHEANVLVIRQDGRALPHYDVWCPLMSLPARFHSTLESVPAPAAYLSVEARHVQPWQALLGPARRPRVGLNWSGDSSQPYDKYRSVPLYLLAPLLAMEVEWHSLQKAYQREDHITLKRFPMLECHHPQLTDFCATAGLIMQCDVIISVDTAVAHLAAALGKPVWLLLPAQPHFRWLQHGEQSPWYPGMRLFRQAAGESWEAVVDRVHQAMTAWLAAQFAQQANRVLGSDPR